MTVRNQKCTNKVVPVHIMVYVREEFQFHPFWLYMAANFVSVQILIIYGVTCPHWYFILYPHTSSIKDRILNEDLANLVIGGKTVVLKSILKEARVSLWTAFHWRKVHC